MKEVSNSSQDRDPNNSQEGTSTKTSKRKREGQTEQSSPDALSKKIKLEQHMKMFGRKSDQLAGTNEVSSSGSDSKASISEADLWKNSNDDLLRIADCCRQLKNYDMAKKSYKYIIDNFESKPQLNDSTIPRALNSLAKLYQNEKRTIDAQALYTFVIDYHAHKPQTDDLDFASALKGMAKAKMEMGKDRQAELVYKSVLSIYKDKFGKDHPKTAGALNDLAQVYQKQKRYDKAKAAYEYAHAIYMDKLGKDHPRTQKVEKNLTDLPEKAGKVDKSESIQKLMDKQIPNVLLNYTKMHRRFPDLNNPQLISEKTLHRNFLDSRPILHKFTDRCDAREFVEGRIGSEYLPKLLCKPTDNPSTIPFETLPDKFVLKSTQGSGRVIVVHDKSTMNREQIIKECEDWLKPENDYYKKTGAKVHKQPKKQIIVEGFIDDGNGSSPNDYKFFTYKGIPKYVQVDKGRHENYTLDMLDAQKWENLPMKQSWLENHPTPHPRPPHLEKMLELAQKLGKDVDFARIDFYDTPTNVYFGEMTVIPGGSTWNFEPAMSNRKFGEDWELHKKTSEESSGPSSEVHNIIGQVNRGILRSAWEGQGHHHNQKGLIMTQKI